MAEAVLGPALVERQLIREELAVRAEEGALDLPMVPQEVVEQETRQILPQAKEILVVQDLLVLWELLPAVVEADHLQLAAQHLEQLEAMAATELLQHYLVCHQIMLVVAAVLEMLLRGWLAQVPPIVTGKQIGRAHV